MLIATEGACLVLNVKLFFPVALEMIDECLGHLMESVLFRQLDESVFNNWLTCRDQNETWPKFL